MRKLAVLCILFIIIFPFLGSEGLNLNDVLVSGTPSHRIFFELRLARLFLVILVGGGLAILGASYQVMFKNDLAEPYVLGTSSAVILGIVSSSVFLGFSVQSLPATVFGLSLAFLATLLLLFASLLRLDSNRVILFGFGLNLVLSSTLFLLITYDSQAVSGGSLRWLFGRIPWVGFDTIGILYLTSIPFVALLFAFGRQLDALSLGDEVARTLGVSPQLSRNSVLFVTSSFLAILVSVTGAIGFVGLVVPHGVRLMFRPSTTRRLFMQSFVVGVFFLGAADILSRAILPPFEFPTGVITTLIGGPVFLYLLWRK